MSRLSSNQTLVSAFSSFPADSWQPVASSIIEEEHFTSSAKHQVPEMPQHTHTASGRRHSPLNSFPRRAEPPKGRRERNGGKRRKCCQLFPLGFVPCVFSPPYYPFVHLILSPAPPPPPPTPVRFVILHLLWPQSCLHRRYSTPRPLGSFGCTGSSQGPNYEPALNKNIYISLAATQQKKKEKKKNKKKGLLCVFPADNEPSPPLCSPAASLPLH